MKKMKTLTKVGIGIELGLLFVTAVFSAFVAIEDAFREPTPLGNSIMVVAIMMGVATVGGIVLILILLYKIKDLKEGLKGTTPGKKETEETNSEDESVNEDEDSSTDNGET